MSDPIVVDASVALKWVLDEDMADRARALSGRSLAAPDLLLSECANRLWRWVRLGALTPETAEARFTALRRAPVRLTSAGVLLGEALRLALRSNHPVYDYLLVAGDQGRGDPGHRGPALRPGRATACRSHGRDPLFGRD